MMESDIYNGLFIIDNVNIACKVPFKCPLNGIEIDLELPKL